MADCFRDKLTYSPSHSGLSRVPNQNGVSLLYIMLEIHHSDPEPSIFTWNIFETQVQVLYQVFKATEYFFSHFQSLFLESVFH